MNWRQIFLATCALAIANASAKDFLVYFGTYTNAISRGIYVSRLDNDTGKLSAPELAAETPSPCFLATTIDGRFLYAANSVKMFDGRLGGSVSAFSVDKKDGRLTLLNEKYSGGEGPCHVSVDAAGKLLLVANYGSGSMGAFLLETNGSIGKSGMPITFGGHGINTNRQDGAHSHFISADASNRFVLGCNLGTDQIAVFALPKGNAELAGWIFKTFNVPPGSGARHLAFSQHPSRVYCLNELNCTISVFGWDWGFGELNLIESISALPPGVVAQNNFTAAEILVHPSGKFVYATIRGHDSVSVFAADSQDGKLTFVQNISAGGNVPRGLGIDPTGRWLITANQKSANVVEFVIDAVTGKLSPTGQELKIGSPVDVKFVAVNAD